MFRFISSYQGHVDFRHCGSGRRLRWTKADGLHDPYGGTVEAAILAEWDQWQAAEKDRFHAWCQARQIDPGQHLLYL